MENSILFNMGFDPIILIVIMFIAIVVLFVLFSNVNMKYGRLRANYNTFMKGKDGKTLENAFVKGFQDIERLEELYKQNESAVNDLKKNLNKNYQKLGIVKYDAFDEMGGKLSFALTMLDAKDNGFLINAMHSREGCYTYIKEIVKGKSYIELAAEEAESLERAIYQETYGLDI